MVSEFGAFLKAKRFQKDPQSAHIHKRCLANPNSLPAQRWAIEHFSPNPNPLPPPQAWAEGARSGQSGSPGSKQFLSL